MAGNLSFSIAINLLTENFKRGTNQVKAAFRSMQMQLLTFAAALGAGGLGLSNLVTRFIDVARETNRVTTALKNVSGSMSQYADNQKYLMDLAKKYGLEINALTGNYAKFTAEASISGMSMENQRKVFESMSRACTAFGMSADDSNGVFLALSQMMSKGKISSEELRLQMGERLPIALQAMAKAAGTSVAGLDKLMKQGKLMSADVLPKFAEALNEMIPNVDTDNLETSVNRLKNTFTEFVNSTDAQSKYKTLIDWFTGMISGLQSKISGFVAFVITIISGKLLGAVVSYFSQFWKMIDTTLSKSKTAEAQKLLFAQKRIEAEKVYESTLTNYNTVENGKRLASKKQLSTAEKALDKAKLAEKKAILVAETAAENAAAVSTTTVWGKTIKTLQLGFVQFGRTLKAVFASSWPLLLITAIAAVISKMVSMRDEANRIKHLFSDYKKESQLSGYTQEVVVLKQQLQIMNDKKQSLDNINNAQSQLQKMLGVEHKSQEELNKLVAKRIELLKETARAEFHARKVVETEESIKGVGDKTYNGKTIREMAPSWGAARGDRKKEEAFKQKYGITSGIDEIAFAWGDFKNDLDSYVEFSKIWQHSNNELKKSTVNTNKLTEGTTPPLGPDDKKEKRTPLQKEQDSYDKQFGELGAELEIGKITQAEYNKALGELNVKMYAQAKGTGDKEVLESEYFKKRKEAAEKAVREQDKNTALVEFEKVQKDYNDKVKENQVQFSKGLMSQKELNENIASLSLEAAKSAAGIKGIDDAADGFIKNMQSEVLSHVESIKIKPRDTTFDYNKSKVDIASENLDKAKELADKYKEQAKAIGKNLSDEVANAMAKVPTLEKALKLAQVREDIKNLNDEIANLTWDGFKGVVSNIDGVVSAFQRLQDAFDPESEATEWERLMAVWNMMTSVVDGILSVADTIENITELTNKLTKAKETEAKIDTVTTAIKVTNDGVETTSELTNLATQTTAEVSANATKTAAATTAMAAGVTAAFAAIPFAGPVLAGAQIAAMKALIMAAAIPFAKGGIISGGPSSGDRILARVNAGEMILNGSQQANLFDAINSGRLGGGGGIASSVTTKIRSKDLILIINNELKSQGKKPIS